MSKVYKVVFYSSGVFHNSQDFPNTYDIEPKRFCPTVCVCVCVCVCVSSFFLLGWASENATTGSKKHTWPLDLGF